MKTTDKEGSTAHKSEPASTNANATGAADGALGMGMTGTDSPGDPDQKSTHNTPKTVESNLPDGSPKYADAGKSAKKASAKAGKYEVVSRVATKLNDKKMVYEPGQIIDLEEAEATSLGDSVKPAS